MLFADTFTLGCNISLIRCAYYFLQRNLIVKRSATAWRPLWLHSLAHSGARSGTAAVEFAIPSPIFILLLMGMIAYGLYFGASHSLQQIAADAARTAIAGLDTTERRDLAMRFISLNASAYPFIDPAKLAIDTHDATADGSQFVVELKYDARQLPIWGLFKASHCQTRRSSNDRPFAWEESDGHALVIG